MNADIVLPEASREGGMPVMEVFARRRSGRDFDPSRELDLQTLSNLLWSAWGVNRRKGRTAPSSCNRQEITAYIFLKSGVYTFDAFAHSLHQVLEEDLRATTGIQPFVGRAPVEIALVADTALVTGKDAQGITEAIYANAGFICENIYLFCAAWGLCTVARALIPKEELSAKLHLAPCEVITLVQSVGYPAPKED